MILKKIKISIVLEIKVEPHTEVFQKKLGFRGGGLTQSQPFLKVVFLGVVWKTLPKAWRTQWLSALTKVTAFKLYHSCSKFSFTISTELLPQSFDQTSA